MNPDHPAIHIAAQGFSDVMGGESVFIRTGGSVPIVGDFATHLGIPTVLMGFGLPDDGLHSPNEKYKLANYYAGTMTIAHFFTIRAGQKPERSRTRRSAMAARSRREWFARPAWYP